MVSPTLSSITAQTATATTIRSAPPFADTLQHNLEFWLKPESKFTIHVVFIVSSYASTSVIMAVIMNRMWEFAQRRRATVLPAASQIMARSIPIMLSLPYLWRLFKASATWGPSWIGALARYTLPASSLTEDTLTDAYPGMFRCICISQLVETFVSLIQGQVPYSESNMSLIEYSLSFHEAAQLKKPVPEIIVICLMGLVSHVFIHLLAIFKLNRYRLIPSALVGLSFLAYFQVQAMKGRLLNFPLILVLGFMPQVIYTYVIFSTVVMEVATMLMTGKRLPSILFERVSLSQDFYTWFEVVSNNVTKSASKNRYINAGYLETPSETWIDQQLRFFRDPNRSRELGPTPGYGNQVFMPPDEVKQLIDQYNVGIANQLMDRVRIYVDFLRIYFLMVFFTIRGMFWSLFRSKSHQHNSQTFHTADGEKVTILSASFAEDSEEEDYVYCEPVYDEDDRAYELHSDYGSEEEDEDEEDEDDMLEEQAIVSETLEEQAMLTESSSGTETEETVSTSRQKKSRLRKRRQSELQTLYDPSELTSIISQPNAKESKILTAHMNQHRLTRSKFGLLAEDEGTKLAQVIMEARQRYEGMERKDERRYCVVCQYEERSVIVWPCRCFALCGICRHELQWKNFKGCVCCRRDVESYSSVFLP
ncbi:Protein ASI1 [Yarrowia sp. C11]|nr:Protein ASI1 [Yarrowia sp. C11]KAG5370745.1 Protein ASI1 [Yarrowia sp. E02]